MKGTLELTDVTIGGMTFAKVDVDGLVYTDLLKDHYDMYEYGEGTVVITDIGIDLVTIFIFGEMVEIDNTNEHWEEISKRVKLHILDDREFMEEWQNREFEQ